MGFIGKVETSYVLLSEENCIYDSSAFSMFLVVLSVCD